MKVEICDAGCSRPVYARGLCHAHYQRLRTKGAVDMARPIQRRGDVAGRFAASVVKQYGCWGWLGHHDRAGYGRLQIGNRSKHAHRVSWELHNGPIPAGSWVLHRCDNPPCCNPAHLFLGDQAANVADMVSKGRNRALMGELHPNAKLTEGDVREIRRAHESGATNYKLAEMYGCSRRNISLIVRGLAWKHI